MVFVRASFTIPLSLRAVEFQRKAYNRKRTESMAGGLARKGHGDDAVKVSFLPQIYILGEALCVSRLFDEAPRLCQTV